jgi:hypothetical protein
MTGKDAGYSWSDGIGRVLDGLSIPSTVSAVVVDFVLRILPLMFYFILREAVLNYWTLKEQEQEDSTEDDQNDMHSDIHLFPFSAAASCRGTVGFSHRGAVLRRVTLKEQEQEDSNEDDQNDTIPDSNLSSFLAALARFFAADTCCAVASASMGCAGVGLFPIIGSRKWRRGGQRQSGPRLRQEPIVLQGASFYSTADPLPISKVAGKWELAALEKLGFATTLTVMPPSVEATSTSKLSTTPAGVSVASSLGRRMIPVARGDGGATACAGSPNGEGSSDAPAVAPASEGKSDHAPAAIEPTILRIGYHPDTLDGNYYKESIIRDVWGCPSGKYHDLFGKAGKCCERAREMMGAHAGDAAELKRLRGLVDYASKDLINSVMARRRDLNNHGEGCCGARDDDFTKTDRARKTSCCCTPKNPTHEEAHRRRYNHVRIYLSIKECYESLSEVLVKEIDKLIVTAGTTASL